MTDYIYALLDPETGQIRYIGKTDNPPERLKNHLNEKGKWHRIHWINSLKKRGLKPVMQIIEEVAEGVNWEDRERYWIAYHRSIGTNLTNCSDGGDCGPDCTGMHLMKSPEALVNLRAMLAERNRTPEMRAIERQNGLNNKGRKHTPETIEKLRQSSSHPWKEGSEERRQKLIERNKAQPKPDPKIMSEKSRRLWDDPIIGAEMRAKLVERNKTMKYKPREFTDEQRRAMSETSKKLWDDPIRGPELKRAMGERDRQRAMSWNAGKKLTKEQVIEIRALPNLSTRELADKYGVTTQMIRWIRKRKAWKYA